jgi:hypothetical protein
VSFRSIDFALDLAEVYYQVEVPKQFRNPKSFS